MSGVNEAMLGINRCRRVLSILNTASNLPYSGLSLTVRDQYLYDLGHYDNACKSHLSKTR